MTTPEFIKLIKACKEGRNKLHGLNWEPSDPAYIITESEFEKIAKVNSELTEALSIIQEAFWTDGESEEDKINDLKSIATIAIQNASNIK